MSPRWLLAVFCLMLMMPAPVFPQISVVITVVKTALCTISSTVFVVASCAKRERLLCRIIAFKLKLLCRTFPCTNYGAPSQRKCARVPFGCAPWNIRPLGLCEPFRVCCSRGGSFTFDDGSDDTGNILSTAIKPSPQVSRNKNTNRSPRGDMAQTRVPAHQNQTTFRIPSSAEEYMKDWPEREDDPFIVEQTIKQQYDKLMVELNAVNEQELDFGREPVQVPSFEQFRSIALGETPVH